jgi:hypothetical protein
MKTFIYSALAGYVKPDLEGGRELINALKSGKYAKTKNILRDDETNTYCCLGVKCDLDGYFNPDLYGQYVENLLHGRATVLPIDHPWSKLYGCALYFPKGFLISYTSTINPDGANDIVGSIAAVNDLTEDFSMVINLLEAAWDCV